MSLICPMLPSSMFEFTTAILPILIRLAIFKPDSLKSESEGRIISSKPGIS
jgi:hypothetical protein